MSFFPAVLWGSLAVPVAALRLGDSRTSQDSPVHAEAKRERCLVVSWRERDTSGLPSCPRASPFSHAHALVRTRTRAQMQVGTGVDAPVRIHTDPRAHPRRHGCRADVSESAQPRACAGIPAPVLAQSWAAALGYFWERS